MKNLIFSLSVLSIFSFLFSSCSSDDAVALPTNSLVGTVKKITETTYYSGIPSAYEMDFNYENGILKSISSGSSNKIEIIMDGNKIVQAKTFSNNILDDVNTMVYDGSNLISIINDDTTEKSEFTYSNGLLSTQSFFSGSGGSWNLYKLDNYFYNVAQNNDKILSTFYQFSNQPTKATYEYDNKNNVFKNMNPYLRYLLLFESFTIISNNNIIKQFSYPNATSTVATQSHYYTIVYNNLNYPITIKKFGVQNDLLISECSILYN